MASLNKTKITGAIKEDKNTMLNHEGGIVHKLNPLEVLFSKVQGTYMGEDSFYEKKDPQKDFLEIKELINNLSQEDAEYALKIAAIGRHSNMIANPLAVLTACFNDLKYKGDNFKDENGKTLMTKYTDQIVKRGKDITDILANQIVMYGFESLSDVNGNKKRSMPLPIQERKQLKRKLEEFDEYQISKALGKNRIVSMADAIKLLRPSGNKCEFFGKVIENKISFGNGKKQVQSELSKLNNKTSKNSIEDVKQSVKDTPLFVIVKNLVAMSRANAFDDEVTEIICNKLTSKTTIEYSRIMPYQLYDAYKMFSNNLFKKNEKKILNALVTAIDLSIENVSDIDGYTAYFVDLSGSMGRSVSGMSSTTAKEVACLLAAIGVKKSTCTVYAFASDCKEVKVSSTSTVVDIAEKIIQTNVGGATYLSAAIRKYISLGIEHDNVVLLSDGDCYEYDTHKGLKLGGFNESCDDIINNAFNKKLIKRVFVNNLTSPNFVVINTDDYRKNLVTGFTEKYIDEINFSIMLEKESGDIRKLINILYDTYFK